ncbi:MAG: beta-propeller domain-containing protein, partial [Acidimicrobiales bacterium]|nr:beta-propeller domain-containing protein [Acidimicrobiales bacterium]
MIRRLLGGLVVLLVLTAGCGSDADLEGEPTGDDSGGTTDGSVGDGASPDDVDLVLTAALEPFAACDAFLDHVHSEGAERVGAYGFDAGSRFGFVGADDAADDVAADDGAARDFGTLTSGGELAQTDSSGGDAGASTSSTNIQVDGVDEADIIKVDGERMVAVAGNRLIVIDLSDDTPVRRGAVQLVDGYDHELFLNGDRALVMSNGDPWALAELRVEAGLANTGIEAWEPVTVVQEIDLSDLDGPSVVRTLHLDGRYLTARAIGSTVRVAVSSPPSGLPFVYPGSPGAEDAALETNRRIVTESALDNWLPGYTLDDGGTVSEGQLVPCDRIHRPAEFAGFDLLSILTFDLNEPLDSGDNTGVLASGETVYASADNVYVATTQWPPTEFLDDADEAQADFEARFTTSIHMFGISGGEPASYQASGVAPGHVLNQFSLDEFEGRLRVAVTEGSPWGVGDTSRSTVLVYEQRGDRLESVGEVTDLGRGERIYAVRFIGSQAYVVTFRQVDPLYVVDLADPTAPRVAGELKIPGFSTYLHPIGDGLLLGLGWDATDQGFTTGMKVSLFDVSDPSAPSELDAWIQPDADSEALWDHRAVTWWGPERLLVLPINVWSGGDAAAVAIQVQDATLVEVGRVRPPAVDEQEWQPVCRPVPPEELSQEVRELVGDAYIQVCTEDQPSGRPDYSCQVYSATEAARLAEQLGFEARTLSENERNEVCYPSGPVTEPVRRTVVAGDRLLSLTW